jgi:dTDP-4-amino-4,6-dideoxygalactose transaminase
MQAVLGRAQLRKMPEWTERRTENAQRLAQACQPFDAVRVPPLPATMRHAWYKFYAFVRPERLAGGWTRDRIIREVNARGVPCYQGACPEIYLEHAFDGTPWRPAQRLPVARELGETSLMLLVHPTLRQAEIDLSCEVLQGVLEQASA